MNAPGCACTGRDRVGTVLHDPWCRIVRGDSEDRFTNTPEDAAAFERRRAEDAGEFEDRPTWAEL